jgi:hypothetical protein
LTDTQTGGWGGIRTHGELAPTPVFKTGALNRSATHPCKSFQKLYLSPDCEQNGNSRYLGRT